MIYLLDSNVCIQLLNGRHRGLIDCFHRHDPQDIVLCSMVKGELRRGALRSQRIELNLQRLETFFGRVTGYVTDLVSLTGISIVLNTQSRCW